jgi:uncharacterized protein (TIGR00730 family)
MKILFIINMLIISTSALAINVRFDEKTTVNFDCQAPQRALSQGELPTALDLARDTACAQDLLQRAAPHGFVTVFGSARDTANINFKIAEDFAFNWTMSELGPKFPIATGGGDGIMKAANKGAQEAGGRSLGLPTQFGFGGIEKSLNKFVTTGPDGKSDSFMFASFSQREAEMIDQSVAIVIAGGGVGTAWELFESVSKVQTGKKQPKTTPIILLGSRAEFQPQLDLLEQFAKVGTIAPQDLALVKIAETPNEAVALIQSALNGQ